MEPDGKIVAGIELVVVAAAGDVIVAGLSDEAVAVVAAGDLVIADTAERAVGGCSGGRAGVDLVVDSQNCHPSPCGRARSRRPFDHPSL